MSITLKQLPLSERPRERLQSKGAHALALYELLAILLSTGSQGESVTDLAKRMVAHFDTLPALLDASIEELMHFKGVGLAKATQLKAAFGIAQKSLEAHAGKKRPILTAKDAFQVTRHLFAEQTKEILVVLLLDVKRYMITAERIALGTLTEVLTHPREVFYPAIKHCALSLILLHNHPSGDPTPSSADLELTRRLLAASQLLCLPLDDHIIVTSTTHLSLKESGVFF